MSNKLKFAVEDIHLLEDESIDTTQFSLLKVDAFSTGRSLHDTYVTEETLKKTAKSILLKPFVFAIDKKFDDLGSHDKDEIPGGFVPHNSRLDFKQLPDGRLMLSVDVLIWRKYSGKLLEYFQRDENKKSVSVEIEVFSSREDESNGLMEIIDFSYNAITGLGSFITSAIPNAEAVMAFSKEFEQAKIQYENFSKYSDIDFTIPKNIKSNAKKSLNSIKEAGKKSNSVYLAIARFLANKDEITPDRIRQLYKLLNRKTEFDEETVGLFGGKQARKWSDEIVKQMNELDDKQMSYYSSEENFLEDETADIGELLSEQDLITVDILSEMEDKDNMAKTKEELEAEEAEKKKVEQMAADEAEAEAKKKADEEAEEAKNKEEKKFSYAEIFATEEDFANMFADEEDDDEDTKAKFASAKEEFGVGANPAVVMSAMYAKMNKMAKKMEKMSEDSKVYMAENEDLKKKFAEIEKGQKEFAVDSFLKELGEKVVIPNEKLSEFKQDSENFSFADIDGWKNSCKALAFEFKPKSKEGEGEEITRYALVNGWTTIKSNSSGWPVVNN